MSDRDRVVIVGGGFAGLHAARSLRRAPVRVTLVDRRNFHLFQPLLYQVATAGLSPANIAAPLRYILRRQRNAEVVLGEVTGFDVEQRRVLLRGGQLSYDTLIVATGSDHSYFGNDHWRPLAPGLKTIEDATEIRRRVLSAFEAAENEQDPQAVRSWLTFVVVGGGPTGVEMAGAIAELARRTLRDDFRHIDPAVASIQIIEAGGQILHTFTPDLAAKAAASLGRLGVTLRTGTTVRDIQDGHVTVEHEGRREDVATRTVVWAAGVQASSLAGALASVTGCPQDRSGRLIVQDDLTIAGHPEIFVLGDLAHVKGPGDAPLPGLAPVAVQAGRHVGKVLAGRRKGRRVGAFRYRDRGTMATIGRAAAIVQMGRLRLSGFAAWVVWLLVHVLQLVQFESRLLVLVQWSWAYFTYNRSARLITGSDEQEPQARKEQQQE